MKDGYRIEYQHNAILGTDEWLIYTTLPRGRMCGVTFDTLEWFPEGTSRELVKRFFWKTYRIDIDRLPFWQRLVKIENNG
jgi:hypothetical protein